MKIIAIQAVVENNNCKKYSDKFIDIDEFIWSDNNKEYLIKLLTQ